MESSDGDANDMPRNKRVPYDILAQQNEELIAENSRLTEAISARDAFLAVAAHELRNPMTPIVGGIRALAAHDG